ncbi:ABC transporter permease subunit, partial [Sphaerochaeta sp. UBA5849]|uniref:ABC transporter permease subunit n=1 Tax=Sphaerochaeta sp. UBA5849 TaxID=1947475 RepID=UPI0039C8F375
FGSYATAILTTRFGWSFWGTLPVAFLLSALFGLLIGLPTLRLKGDYLAIATLGFGEIVRNV